jgi:hypothetical protein
MSANYTPIDHLLNPPVQPQQPQQPEQVSISKEGEPIPVKKQEALTMQETVEHEHVEEEVKPFVEVKPQNIQLPPELKQLGLKPIEKTKFKDVKNIKLPISDDKIVLGMHAPINSSLRWLATFSLYLLRQAHLSIKVVHGKAVRIFKK